MFKILAWALLLFNSFRHQLFRKYRLIYVMILVSMVSTVFMQWLQHQVSPISYAWMWVGSAILSESLATVVLLQICSISRRLSLDRDWHLPLVAVVLGAITFLDGQEAWVAYRLVIAFRLAVTYLGVATLVRTARCKNLELGWNLRMVLLAVTIPSVFSHLILHSYALRMLSQETVNLWLSGVGLAAWIILAVGMMEYSPPVLRSDPERNPLDNGFAKEATSTRNLG